MESSHGKVSLYIFNSSQKVHGPETKFIRDLTTYSSTYVSGFSHNKHLTRSSSDGGRTSLELWRRGEFSCTSNAPVLNSAKTKELNVLWWKIARMVALVKQPTKTWSHLLDHYMLKKSVVLCKQKIKFKYKTYRIVVFQALFTTAYNQTKQQHVQLGLFYIQLTARVLGFCLFALIWKLCVVTWIFLEKRLQTKLANKLNVYFTVLFLF